MRPIFISKKKFDVALSKRAAEICEQIITEMGAEIHDDFIQKLSVFQFSFDKLERSADNPEEIASLVFKMRTDFEKLKRTVRSISSVLIHQRMEHDTFQNIIDMLCQNMSSDRSGNVHLDIDGDAVPIPELPQTYLCRIIQELVHNAFKHSSAWHIWVRLKWKPQVLFIEIEDDGTNFLNAANLIENLEKKYSTIKIRSQAIGAHISYHTGTRGLIAKIKYPLPKT